MAGDLHLYHLMVEQSQLGMALFQPGRLLYANPAFGEITGIPTHALSNGFPEDLFQSILEIKNASIDEMIDYFQHPIPESKTLEIKILTQNKCERWLEVQRKIVEYDQQPAVFITCSDITARKKVQQMEESMLRIALTAESTDNLGDFIQLVHTALCQLMPVENFSVTLYDEEKDLLRHLFIKNNSDIPITACQPSRGLTEYVLRSHQALLATRPVIDQLVEAGEIDPAKVPSTDWMGVPLRAGEITVGVMAALAQSSEVHYTQDYLDIFEFVATQIGMVINRKGIQDALLHTQSEIQMLAKILNSSTQPFVIGYLDGQILDVNPAFCTLVGYSMEELLQISWSTLTPPEYHALDQEMGARVFTKAEEITYEKEFIRRDGTRLPIEVHMHQIEDRTPENSIFYAFITDISERKRTERALRISEHLHHTTLDALDEWIFVVTPELRIVLANHSLISAMRSAGSTHNLLGSVITEKTHFLGSSFKEYRQVFEQGLSFRGIYQQKIKNREYVVEIHKVPVYEGGKVLRALTVIRDISEQQRAAEEIEAQYAFLRKVIDTDPNLIFVKDPGGRFILVNQATASLYGLSVEKLTGLAEHTVNPNKEEVAIFYQDDQEVLQTHQQKIIPEEWITDFAGNRHILQVIKLPLFDSNGKATQVLGVATDISERRRREMELEGVTRLSASLRQARNRAEMIPLILDHLISTLNAAGAILLEADPEGANLVATHSRGDLKQYAGRYLPSTSGFPASIIHQGDVYFSDHFDRDLNNALAEEITGSDASGEENYGVCIPLKTQSQTTGAICINRRVPFDSSEIRLVSAVADIAANALHRASLHEQTERRLRYLNALHQIDIAIAAHRELSPMLTVLLQQVLQELEADAACILLLHPLSQVFKFASGLGFYTNYIEYSHVKMGEGLAGNAGLKRKTIYSTDLEHNPTFTRSLLLSGENFVSYCCTPLLVKGEVKGILEVFQRKPAAFPPEWIEFLEMLAGQAAIAVESAQLFNELERTNAELVQAYDATIEGWSRALDLRDMETEGHSQRVAQMSVDLARKMGLSGDMLVQIYRGALLHDIGKMGIPDHILLKPGDLSREEWQIMRKHPSFAFEMLSPITFLSGAIDIPYYHHEKWDGTGYPHGLIGTMIPIAARIFSVVDVWDALISNRPYRTGWSKEQTLQYLCDQSGKQFDPDVVSAFVEMIHENGLV